MLRQLLKKALEHPIVTILLFGIVTRLLCVLLYQHVTVYPDSEGYLDLARYASTFNFSGYDGLRNPGYPLLIALAANSLPVTAALQMVIGLATAVGLYKTLLALHIRRQPALISTLLLNSLLHVIFYETAILTESLTLFFITLMFYLLFTGFLVKQSWRKITLLGIVLGCLVLIKPFYIYMPFLLYGLYVINNFNWSKVISNRLVILVFPLLSYFGWSYVNKVNTGYFTSTSLHGIYLSQNCVHFAENVPARHKLISDIYVRHRRKAIADNKDVAMSIWYAYDELREKTGMGLAELSNEMSIFSKDAIKQNPWLYLKQVITLSWRDFWKVDMYWNYNDFKIPYANKALLVVWLPQMYLLLAIKIMFVLLLPYYAYRFLKTKILTSDIIIAIIVFTTSVLQAIVTYGTNSRFSYPFEFLIVVCVLITFGRFFKKLQLKKV